MTLTTEPVQTAADEATSRSAETFDSLDPATGDVVGTWAVQDGAAVDAAVARAHDAAVWWAAQGFQGRKHHLQAWKGLLARRAHELADVVHHENGKPHDDALLEILLAVDHIDFASKKAAKLLGPRKVSSGLMAANQASWLEYQPFGVVGVIGPWNYPVFTPMGSIAYALSAGNAVVFKPSEYTPGVGAWMVQAWQQAVPQRPDVLQLLTGLGDTGAALCRADIGKLAFTGSSATGRKVMAACAENLTPVLMECGGKDAMIVDDGADVKKAAAAALWAGMSNAGQTCIGIERVYATDGVYDEFVRELLAGAQALKPGSHDGADYGPTTMPGQLDVIAGHIEAARAGGGRVALGGDVVDGVVQPTVLLEVPEDNPATCEETFGPTISVTRVPDAEEALRRTNATSYGLAGSVFSGSKARGMDLARRMRSGMTSVNSVIAFASVPSLPFGGVGESGFGRIHGEDGLKEFTRAKAITRERFALPIPLLSFDRPEKTIGQMTKLFGLIHGRAR